MTNCRRNGERNWIIVDGATRDGQTFEFAEVHIDGNGWLVMHPFENGKPNGDVVSGSTYVANGTNTDVNISVTEEVAAGDMFIVMLHRDVDEDREFDFVFVGDTGHVEDKAVFEGNKMIGHAYPAQARPSFATSRLVVTVPEDWVAASAGARSEEGGALVFESEQALPALSLNAGPFEELSMEVGGKTFRLLYAEMHARNVEFFKDAGPVLREKVAERLESMKRTQTECESKGQFVSVGMHICLCSVLAH